MALDVAKTFIKLRTNGVKTGILKDGFKKDLHRILEKVDPTNYFWSHHMSFRKSTLPKNSRRESFKL